MQDDNQQRTNHHTERLDASVRLLQAMNGVAEDKSSRLHASYQRLVDAAGKMRGLYGGMAPTNALHYSDPQLVNNWQRRGVSRDGALDIERHLGIPAIYIIDGTMPNYEEWQRLKAITITAEQPIALPYASHELSELNEICRSIDKESLRAIINLIKKLYQRDTHK